MKKISILIAMTLVFALSSCGQQIGNTSDTQSPVVEEKTNLENLKDAIEEEVIEVDTEVPQEGTPDETSTTQTEEAAPSTAQTEVSPESQKLIEEAEAELETLFLQNDLITEILGSE